MKPHDNTRIVLVTGASRGIGADVAAHLARPDTHVIVNYREQAQRADDVVNAIRNLGGQASALAADIGVEHDAAAMFDDIGRRFGRLDAVVLNASSGLDEGVEPGYAIRVNRDTQRRLARLALPLMPVGGHIVFVTNHQAHFYPYKAVPKGYASIAAGKRAGETTLYAMRAEFERRGVSFTVVSGELIEDDHFATAIADAVTSVHPTGVVYVHGRGHALTA